MAINPVSTSLGPVGAWFETTGVSDAILPFLLIFTLIFAVLERVKLFGEEKKRINVMVSLLISLITVIPHLTASYPRNYDPIDIINAMVPSAAVLAVIIILVLFLFGIFGKEFVGGGSPTFIVVVILLVLFYIFGATVGWWETPGQTFGSWFGSDLSTIVIIILVFALIFWFIVAEPPKTHGENLVEKVGRWFFR